MPLAVEDGSGVPGADSFVDLATADGYWIARGSPDAWFALNAEAREGRLREAAGYLGDEKRLPWTGEPLSWDQALAWPRRGAARRGLPVPENAVPEPVRQAQCWLAFTGFELGVLGDRAVAAATGGNIQSQSVGEISVSYFAPDQLAAAEFRPGQTAAPAGLLGLVWPYLRQHEVDPNAIPAIGPLGLLRPFSRFKPGPTGGEP